MRYPKFCPPCQECKHFLYKTNFLDNLNLLNILFQILRTIWYISKSTLGKSQLVLLSRFMTEYKRTQRYRNADINRHNVFSILLFLSRLRSYNNFDLNLLKEPHRHIPLTIHAWMQHKCSPHGIPNPDYRQAFQAHQKAAHQFRSSPPHNTPHIQERIKSQSSR